MSLLGRKEKKEIDIIKRQLISANKNISVLKKRNRQLVNLCNTKDSFFKKVISDGLRHGSPLAAKHMVDRRNYLNGK